MELIVVSVYVIYLECEEGVLDPSWNNDEPSDLWEFRDSI